MDPVREGGCLCGAVRYRAQGNPARTVACHCRSCPRCGTALTSTFEKGPGEVAILGGTFDDTGWITVDRHVWTRSAHAWVSIPAGVASFEKSSSGS